MRVKSALVILLVTAIALFLLGGYLQSLYGLDPPYEYVFTGLIMQLASVGIAVVAAILLVVRCIRDAWW